MAWLPLVAAGLASLVGQAACQSYAQEPSVAFSVLGILKAKSTVPSLSGEYTQDELDTCTEAFLETLPGLVHNLTRGTVRFDTEVVVSHSVLTDVDWTAGGSALVGPEYCADDIEKFDITLAKYDNVIVMAPFEENNWVSAHSTDDKVGWSSVSKPSGDPLGWGQLSVFVHEFMHPTEAWYWGEDRLGDRQKPTGGDPNEPPSHLKTEYGYEHDTGGEEGLPLIGYNHGIWSKYYMDFFNGEICMRGADGECTDDNSGPIGLGPNAWKFPTKREAHLGLEAGYMAKHEPGAGAGDSEPKDTTSPDAEEEGSVDEDDVEDDAEEEDDMEDDAEEDDAEEDDAVEEDDVEKDDMEDDAEEEDDMEDDAEEEDDMEDDAVEDDAEEEDDMEDDAVEDDAVEDDAVEDDAVEDDAVEEDDVEKDDMEDDAVEEDDMEEDAVDEDDMEEDDMEEDEYYSQGDSADEDSDSGCDDSY